MATAKKNKVKTKELQATLSIALTLAQPGDFQQNISLALKKLAEFAECEECILRMPSGPNLVARVFYQGSPFRDNHVRESIPITNTTAAGQAYLQRKPSIVNDYENYPNMLQANLEKGYRSLAAVPIVIGAQSIGVISIVSTKKDHFTKERIDDISAVSTQLGPFLENARLNEELKAKDKAIQKRSEQLETILNMARILSQPGSFKERAKHLVEEISDITSSDAVTLRLFDADDDELLREVVSVNRGNIPITSPSTVRNQGLGAEAVRQGKIIFSNDYLNEPAAKNTRAADAGINSAMFVPIKVSGKVVGTMNLAAKLKNHFTLEHILFLTAVSDELGAMLENARLTEEIAVTRELEKRTQTFISMASHELRTPLTGMLGFAELLRDNNSLEDEQREWLNVVNEQGQRLATIVDDMLSVSRIRSGTTDITPEAFSLKDIVQRQVDLLSKTTFKHNFEISAPPGLKDIVADKEKVARVLNNLITNAIKYSPDGGAVRISITHEPSLKLVVVSVKDEGIGISAEDRDRIFSVFQRVNRPETRDIQGSGLGLYIVKGLVELMHGSIWVESEINKGSTFSFSLPAS